ncbi:MAG: hypothetical protein M9894_39705 [Planctomycetes bacterium]|nr:hypothetical protein [Planctomycetota bacterium]
MTVTVSDEDVAQLDRLGGRRAEAASRALRLGLELLRVAREWDDPDAALESRWRPLLRRLPRRWERRGTA